MWRQKATGPKQDQNPAEQTLSSVIPCPAPRVTYSDNKWTLRGLGDPIFTALPVALPTPCSLLRMFFSSFSNFLGSPLHFWLHSHIDLSGAHHLLFQSFFWNTGGTLPNPTTLAFWTCETSTMWISWRSAANLSSSQALLHHGCSDLWVLGWLSSKTEIPFPRWPFWSTMSWALFSKWSLLLLDHWTCEEWDFTNSQHPLKLFLILSCCKILGFFLMLFFSVNKLSFAPALQRSRKLCSSPVIH